MLIRSQDKKNIIVLNNIKSIYLRDCSTDIRTYYGNGYSEIIGTYSTEEKAIKVLEMICEKYQEPICENEIEDYVKLSYKNIIFQMPQDEEVQA